MFLCPPRQEGVEGGTDATPIPLPGVTRHEFETLLNYLYKGYDMLSNTLLVRSDVSGFDISMHNDIRFSHRRWIALLSIASRYDMDKIRERAIKQISRAQPSVDPVDKIILAEKHDISTWLVPAYIALCHRETTLEESEAMKLGLSVTVKLNRAREAVRALGPRRRSSVSAIAEYDSGVLRIVKQVFWPSAE